MRVIICKDYDHMSKWASHYIAQKIKQNRNIVLGLPTGSTVVGTYKQLIVMCQQEVISFGDVATFNMDEYVGLPESHPQSYRYFMQDNFFGHIDIKHENIHILNGLAPDLIVECDRFEKEIIDAGGIDIFVGGIGTDGHLAFNEPGSSLQSHTRIKTLTDETRESNARFFHDDISQVPQFALTVGVKTVTSAKEVLLLASGSNKAFAIQKTIEEGVNHLYTASALQLHEHAIVVCDESAAEILMYKTVRYFKEVEKNNLTPWIH